MLLPEDFKSLMRQHLGTTSAESLFTGLCEEPIVSIRLNPHKTSAKLRLEPVPWCPEGYYLTERPAFTYDPLLHAGVYYVQEASSMYLSDVLRQFLPSGDVVVLDLCAAPGGKSTLMSSCLPEDSLLVCNEPVHQRALVLAENMVKWGHPSYVVTQNKPTDFAHFIETFDVVLTDVPCSGEGMFRKDKQALSEWSLENVSMCWRRQRAIVQGVWQSLKSGGLMVYSTCTFNRFEDEDNVTWIASELGAEVLSQRHFFPGTDRGEGLFIAVLRKHGNRSESYFTLAESSRIESLSGNFVLRTSPHTHVAMPAKHAELIDDMRQNLRVLCSGITIKTAKGKDWLPSHQLALCTEYIRGTYPEAEVTYEQAISYLRHETIRINAPKGIVLLTYLNHPLGFVKNLGIRANNLYPKEWRIRSTHQPFNP